MLKLALSEGGKMEGGGISLLFSQEGDRLR